jgi:hypothetical protein
MVATFLLCYTESFGLSYQPSLAHAALDIVRKSGMVVFPRTGMVQSFVIAASIFVIGEEVRRKVTTCIIGEAKVVLV